MAASITFFAFLALFPLILLAMSVVGFIVAEEPEIQLEWATRVSALVPGLEDLIIDNLERLADGRAATGFLGLVSLVWVGLRVVDASRFSLARIFRRERARSAVKKKVKTLGSLVLLGALGLSTTALAGAIGADGDEEVALKAVGFLVAAGLDFVFFIVAYRVLTPGWGPKWRVLWPGALLAAVGWVALKFVGSWFATRTVASASELYGSFAAALGVLALLHLSIRVFLYGAIVNSARVRERDSNFLETP